MKFPDFKEILENANMLCRGMQPIALLIWRGFINAKKWVLEDNYKALNLITTALGRNVYDHVSHLETAHDVWLKIFNIYEGSSGIK
jgi:hypothetical protein